MSKYNLSLRPETLNRSANQRGSMKVKYNGQVYDLREIRTDKNQKEWYVVSKEVIMTLDPKLCEVFKTHNEPLEFECFNCKDKVISGVIPKNWQPNPNNTWVCPKCNKR